MSAHPIRAQVADVVAQGPTGKPWRGSGYLIADGWVLTAQHVVAGATKVAVWLGAPTRLDPAGRRDVDLEHARVDEDTDLALLPIAKGIAGQVEPALFGRLDRDSAAPVPAVAAGCPRFKLRADAVSGKSTVRELHVAHGTITPASNARTGTYELAVNARPPEDPQGEHSPWESMSGAAVWADQRIIGVVAQHHPDEGTDVLTVKPLETLFTSSTGLVDQWCTALGPVLPKRPGDLWLVRRATAGEAEVQQAREIAARYSPEQLLERDEELASLDLLLTSDARWCWIQGETFAGKTALLAWVATHPPPGITVVSCFLRSTTGENTASYALSTLNEQLAAVANRVDHQEALYFSEQKIQLHTLLANAARSCQERGRRLVVIIDGLDEHEPHGNSLKKWLIDETELPQNAMLLAASRTGVEVELPAYHPLRAHVRTLIATQVAVELRELAEEELHQVLAAKNRLEYAIAGLVATSVGGLASSELTELLHRVDSSKFDIEISSTLDTSFHRTLISAPAPTGQPVYVFAHAVLEQIAREWLAKDLPKFEATLLSWCDDYRDRNFPEDTPDYVLSHYPEHLYAAARTNQLPIQAADAIAEALSRIYSNMSFVERVVITLGIDHLMRTMRSLVSREELTNGINDALNSLMRLFSFEAPHLQSRHFLNIPGYAAQQLALQSLAIGHQDMLHQAQQHLFHLPGKQFIPQWTTTRANSALISILFGHLNETIAVAVTPNCAKAVTASRDHTARVWDLNTGALVHTLEGHTDAVEAVGITPDGTRAVTASRDHTARVWDLNTGNSLHLLEGHTEPLKAVAVTPDSTRAVTASSDGTARIWDLSTGTQLHLLAGHTDAISAVAITSDGTWAMTASWDRRARVWDMNIGEQLYRIKGHFKKVEAVAVTSDGTRAVTASSDGTARVWDLSTGHPLHRLEGHTDAVVAVAVTPDSTRAVTASSDGTARIWDLHTGEQVHVLRGHTEAVLAVVMTPDGTRAVTASSDGTARVWDLSTGHPLHRLEGHTDAVVAVAVTPDSTRAVTASSDGTARIWDLTTDTLEQIITTGSSIRDLAVCRYAGTSTLTIGDSLGNLTHFSK
ncbi:trypsin-like serine protease [Kocuria kalidii]|uniref:trypsin-like serine protease n=1 Tax=Kocuria kalidii TaxID=3376283 RepID=UPI0037B4D58D